MFAAEYDISEARAAPAIPQRGMRLKFKITFNSAATKLAHISNLVLPIVSKVMPFGPKDMWKIKPSDKIRSAGAASTYREPKKQFRTDSGKRNRIEKSGKDSEKIHFVRT